MLILQQFFFFQLEKGLPQLKYKSTKMVSIFHFSNICGTTLNLNRTHSYTFRHTNAHKKVGA